MKKVILCSAILCCSVIQFSYASNYTPAQEQILSATHHWQVAIDSHNVQSITALYDTSPHFYPTFQNGITSQDKVIEYFTHLAEKPALAVTLQKEYPRVYGDVGINSGFYTFSYQNQGKTVMVPARFTFIYLKENGTWMIIEHHSSLQPEAAQK